MNPTKEEIEEALAHFAHNNIRLLDMDWSMAQTLAAAYREAIKRAECAEIQSNTYAGRLVAEGYDDVIWFSHPL